MKVMVIDYELWKQIKREHDSGLIDDNEMETFLVDLHQLLHIVLELHLHRQQYNKSFDYL